MSGRFVNRVVALAASAAVVATGVPVATADVDTTPPVLHGVTLSPVALAPGGNMTATVDATDDVAVTRVLVGVLEETSGRVQTLDVPGTGLTAAARVAGAWANGTYRVRYVVLYDAAGNYSVYYRNGTYASSPASAATTHGLDLTTQQATVSGASDLSPPVLSALTTSSVATRAEDSTTVAFAVSDAESTVQSIALHWTNADTGERLDTVALTNPGATGTLQARLPTAGRWQLSSVKVTDARGNTASYVSDGRILRSGLDGTHTLDLAAVHLALAPGPQQVRLVPRPGALTLVRTGNAAEDEKLLLDYDIRVQPAGIVRVVTRAQLASGLLDLTGLPNGVTQTVSLTARSQWGDSPVATVSGRPVLSGNVTGVEDVTGDGRSDVIGMRQWGLSDRGSAIWRWPGTGAGRLRAATALTGGENWRCEALAPGHLTYQNTGAPLCQTEGLSAIYEGGGEVLGMRGWRSMQWVDGGYSLNADGIPDVVTVSSVGDLLLYPRTSTGRLLAPVRMATGWGPMISVVSAGDLTGDRRNDVAAVDAAGRLWLYPGDGRGGLTTRRQMGSGWQTMGALLPLRDLSGDGRADLGGITASGELRLYAGTGTGGLRTGVVIGTGWQVFL